MISHPTVKTARDGVHFAEDLAPDPRLYNDDLAPTQRSQRTWNTYNYIALWFSMSMEVTTYMLAASLIAGGMNWKQAIGTILLGNLIVLIPMLLNAHAGTKYGIPFPVFVRASFGPVGANIPAMLRANASHLLYQRSCWQPQLSFRHLHLLLPAFDKQEFLKFYSFCFAYQSKKIRRKVSGNFLNAVE